MPTEINHLKNLGKESLIPKKPDIKVLEKVFLPKSLGHFYSAVCNYIGFEKFGEEYKVMGLSAYGEDKYSDYFEDPEVTLL